VDPTWKKSSTLKFDPSLCIPKTEQLLAKRMKLSRLKLDPRWIKSSTVNEEPNRDMP
jgi:hypothetical protein